MLHIIWGGVAVIIAIFALRLNTANAALTSQLKASLLQIDVLQRQLAEAVQKVTQHETANAALTSQLAASRLQIDVIQKQLAEAVQKLAQYVEANAKSNGDGLFQMAVEGLVALGVPGLVLLIAVSVSGLAGAAALTSALAALGGPFGMVGGIGVLLLLVLVSKALTKFGLPKMAQAVVRGLIAKGESAESIRRKVESIPKWVISRSLRAKLDEVLAESA